MRVRHGAASLSRPVRPTVLVRYLGQLSSMLGALMLVPLAAAMLFGEMDFATSSLAMVVLLLLLGWCATRLSAVENLQTNEALVTVGLAYALFAPLLSIPFWASGLALDDALFEAVSAITTTGLTTVGTVEGRSAAFLFTRAWIQWFGGLGIVVFSVALLMGHHAAARRLAGGDSGEPLETTARTHARRVLRVYVGLTLGALVALWALTGQGFTALLHAFTSVATGGFSSYDESIAAFDGWLPRVVIMLFAFAGAIPLALYHAGWRALRREPEVHVLLLAVSIGCTLLALLLRSDAMSTGESILHALVLGISAQTNTGFSSLPVDTLGEPAKLLLVVAMFIGGSAGSTAGGIKIARLMVLLALVRLGLLQTTLPPHAVATPRIRRRVLELGMIQRGLNVIGLFILTIAFSWFLFVLAGFSALDALFEVTSATSTTGLSTGIARPDLDTALKVVLIVDMLLGRVEVLALLLIVYPPTWIGPRAQIP
jgi:trk system potassium uptake protein TrkH